MKQHLQRTRQVEEAIRTELLREDGHGGGNISAKRVLVDLIDVRLKVIDRLVAQYETENTTPLDGVLARVHLHFDKDNKSPYKTFRGPTPAHEPSLPKDIATIFEALVERGIYHGPCPVLDPKWEPLP